MRRVGEKELKRAHKLFAQAAAVLRESTVRGEVGDKIDSAFMHAVRGFQAIGGALATLRERAKAGERGEG